MQSTIQPYLAAMNTNNRKLLVMILIVTIFIYIASTVITEHLVVQNIQLTSSIIKNVSYADTSTNTTHNTIYTYDEGVDKSLFEDFKRYSREQLGQFNYSNNSNDINIIPFWPSRALDEYKRWHSNDVLLGESISYIRMNRKFSVVYYWCPDRAGNIFHNMYNTIIWSIISNRTILMQFDYSWQNSIDDCNKILQLASWIPRYDEWSTKLKLRTEKYKPVPIPTMTTINTSATFSNHNLLATERYMTVIFPQLTPIQPHDKSLYRATWNDEPFRDKHFRYIQRLGDYAKDTIGKLYYEGRDFLMGMLFRESFVINDSILTLLSTTTIPTNNNTFSIALHSRHPVVEDLGQYINYETTCLQKTLPKKTSSDSCFVYLMSDRVLTMELLARWLIERNCTPIYFNSTSTSPSDSSLPVSTTKLPVLRNGLPDPVHGVREHGSRAGSGFLIDVLTASQARSGYIGTGTRSSSLLVIELMTYDRKIEAWKHGTLDALSDIKRCSLRERFERSGYNYGPGTPTFKDRPPKT